MARPLQCKQCTGLRSQHTPCCVLVQVSTLCKHMRSLLAHAARRLKVACTDLHARGFRVGTLEGPAQIACLQDTRAIVRLGGPEVLDFLQVPTGADCGPSGQCSAALSLAGCRGWSPTTCSPWPTSRQRQCTPCCSTLKGACCTTSFFFERQARRAPQHLYLLRAGFSSPTSLRHAGPETVLLADIHQGQQADLLSLLRRCC